MAPGGIGVTISKKHITNYLLNLKALSKGGYMGLIVVKVLDISYIINYVVIFIHKICIGNASHARQAQSHIGRSVNNTSRRHAVWAGCE